MRKKSIFFKNFFVTDLILRKKFPSRLSHNNSNNMEPCDHPNVNTQDATSYRMQLRRVKMMIKRMIIAERGNCFFIV